jgi:uncharacterized tellurite resistance protein B-like protein
MGLDVPPREAVPYGLRAMKTVALADGTFAAIEKRLMTAAAAMLGTKVDLDALEPITADELAANVPERRLREQLIGGMLVLAMADEDVSDDEIAVIGDFSRALHVPASYVRELRRLARGHVSLVRYDLARRPWVREKVAAKAEGEGLPWIAKTVAAMDEHAPDPELADRYRELGSLPAGTLGHAYALLMRENHFALPGEKGAPPERVALHDMTHVLTGYGTDPTGEMEIAFFHAGAKRADPFFFTFFIMLQSHLGISAAPTSRAEEAFFDPDRCLRALSRGSQSLIDPLEGWDPWPVVGVPVSELRERYRIGDPPA